MDIYEYLERDHQKVADLFEQFEAAKGLAAKKEIIQTIAQELIVHAQSEEKTFYKVLVTYKESKKEVFHGEKEHKDIEALISIVLDTQDAPRWEQNVRDLKELVEHHVKDEEGDMFAEARKVISSKEAYAIKEQMHTLKLALLREHQVTA